MIKLLTFIKELDKQILAAKKPGWMLGNEKIFNVERYLVASNVFDEIEHHANKSKV